MHNSSRWPILASPTIARQESIMRIAHCAAALIFAGLFSLAQALSLADLTLEKPIPGLREALTTGADFAVSSLGKENGFLGNNKVKIPLPESPQGNHRKGLRALV